MGEKTIKVVTAKQHNLKGVGFFSRKGLEPSLRKNQ
jgi:hypothetical protein